MMNIQLMTQYIFNVQFDKVWSSYMYLWHHHCHQCTNLPITAQILLVALFNPSFLSTPLPAPSRSLICFFCSYRSFFFFFLLGCYKTELCSMYSSSVMRGSGYFLSAKWLRFIHVVALSTVHFLIAAKYSIILECHNLCIRSPVDGDLGVFSILC